MRFGVSAIWCPTRITFYRFFALYCRCDLVCNSEFVLPLPLRAPNRTANRMVRVNGSNSVSDGVLTLCPLSLCPRSLCPGHFVPWSLCPRSLCPRSLSPLVTLSPGHFVPVTLSPVTLSPGHFVPPFTLSPVTLSLGHFVPGHFVPYILFLE
jgi:hypothetical protein